MSRILITGIAGSLAQITADQLIDDGHEVIGVDYRKRPFALRNELHFYQANYNKTRIEEAFRKHHLV